MALVVGHIQDLLFGPVEVVGDVRYLFVELIQRVAGYSPGARTSSMGMVMLSPQWGHWMVTSGVSWVLICS